MTGVRAVVEQCLGKDGDLSVREDVLGVYGDDNPQDRSVRTRLDRLRHDPFVRLGVVTVRQRGSNAGQYDHLQRDLDSANTVFQQECGLWVYPVESRVERTNLLGQGRIINQNDCWLGSHTVSREEDELFDLGRDMDADVICYCIGGDTGGLVGCAAHPDGRPGFWIEENPGRWTLAHELGHVVGGNQHTTDNSNLMFPGLTIQNPPPDLTGGQCNRVTGDEHTERCE
jgi:hypothetical protein